MPWLGLLVGGLLGAAFFGLRGLAAGAALGIVAGWLLNRSSMPAALPDRSQSQRIALLEARVAALEAALARAGAVASATPSDDTASVEAPAKPSVDVAVASPAQTSGEREDTKSGPEPSVTGAVTHPPRPAADAAVETAPAYAPVRKGAAGERVAAAAARPSTATASTTSSLWSWFTNGNTLARIGIVVLFFGIAFLLSYLAEHVTVPIELQFAGVAFAGAALIVVGAWLIERRRAYALALLGGGLGVLYLTAFAALELVPLLKPATAFILLAAISTLAIALALAFDAQALAALATLGGLLAPVLVDAVTEPLPLFGYVALINAVIVGVAWFRAWRWLDLIGFIGTFLLGLWWGQEYYDPAYFHLAEPFLAGFFLAYVAVPIVHAWRGAGERRVDAVLVFGVPMVTFALQALLVHDVRYGLAWSAAGVAALYAVLWLRLRRSERGALLGSAFGALAVIFATLTVPLAVDSRWTSAAWAIEAAGVYWVGCRDDRRFARAFALALQLATGIAFVLGGLDDGGVVFANRRFVGIAAIALSAFATARFGDHRREALPAFERTLLDVVFVWGCLWWLGGGVAEMADHVATQLVPHAMLAWAVGSVAVAVLLAELLAWHRLGWTALILLPSLLLSFVHDLAHARTSLTQYGWVVYPFAWTLHFVALRRGEVRAIQNRKDNTNAIALLVAGHTAAALLLVGQIAWEAGEWTARIAPRDSVWPACAHLMPLALYLFGIARSDRETWPLMRFANAYATSAGTVVAVALALGFVALAILHPGNPSPLPYVPLANPLEISLLIALAALYAWARRDARASPRALYRALAIGAFIVLNGVVVRAVHHWLGVPWNVAAILASRPLQAALTLTWTVAALAAMVAATRNELRILWFTGAGLLAAVVVKLFAVDLAALSGLTRVVAFLGVGALLLVIGYVAPLPPTSKDTARA